MWKSTCGAGCAGNHRRPMRVLLPPRMISSRRNWMSPPKVANDYFELRTLDADYNLITNTIEADRRSFALTQKPPPRRDRLRPGCLAGFPRRNCAHCRGAKAGYPIAPRRDAPCARHHLRAINRLIFLSPRMFQGILPSLMFRRNCPANCWSIVLTLLPLNVAWRRPMQISGLPTPRFFRPVRINGLAGFQSVDASFVVRLVEPPLVGRSHPSSCRSLPAAV